MNHSRYLTDSRRSPYAARRRKSLVPRSPDLARSLPAITLLEPNGYRLEPRPFSPNRYQSEKDMAPRPLSPGIFRIAPPRSAKNKMTSFVILNENITSPVTSRAPSPSGRVSPFRGHGFKSPTASRQASRAASPTGSPNRKKSAVKVVPLKPKNIDIGLPPKSPKRVVKSVKTKEFKPVLKPKPILVNNTPGNKADDTLKGNINKKAMVMSTVDKKKDKKPPVPPKNPEIGKSKGKLTKTDEKSQKKESKNDEKKDAIKENDSTKAEEDEPVVVSEVKVESSSKDSTNLEPPKVVDKEERLIPCFQPDKCCIVPPTMASPSQTVTTSTTTVPLASTTTSKVATSRITAISSALSVTDALSKRSALRPKPSEASKPSPMPVNEVSASNMMPEEVPANVESVVATMTTVDEIIKSRVGSAASQVSVIAAVSPTLSERTRSSMVTVRAASNGSLRENGDTKLTIAEGVAGAAISSTTLIRADPDFEVLSPNNLLNSPPDGARDPLFDDSRVPNGQATASNAPKGRCSRFLASFLRLLTYIFCCCKRWKCCLPGTSRWACWEKLRCKPCKCCPKRTDGSQKKPCCPTNRCHCWNPCSALKSCFQKLNCCKNLKCSSCCKNLKCSPCCKSACCKKPFCKTCSPCCDKLKCCEGKCCKRTKKKTTKSSTASTTMCCAKPSCSCKDCCAKLKDCCSSCSEKVNSVCRSMFCLNLMCCQRCLKKCTCCHKLKCCQKAGCCSCCNPHVKREQKQRLDKKTSRASNKSIQSQPKLDAALVEHASVMKAAIPVLPACLAWLCLILNFLIPGSGTLLAGLLCLCFGKPRFSVNDSPQNRVSAFLVNVVIAVAQAFTIIFCLVGWGWSMWWGVIMVKLARKQRRLRIAEKNQEAAPSTNHVDPERGGAR